MRPRIIPPMLLLVLVSLSTFAQEPGKAQPDDPPVLRLQAGGPTSYVTGLAFSPDGKRLYEAGWDKVVRIWIERAGSNRFALEDRLTLRVPVGPGLDGALNALAVSSDGAWVAVAGRGIIPGGSGFHQDGLVIPAAAKNEAMYLAEGTVYVFKTDRSAPDSTIVLKGHRGPVLSLAFAPSRPDKPPLLVSAAHDRDRAGELRVWDVSTRQTLRVQSDLPSPARFKTRPSLAAWHTGAGPTQLRVAVAWWAGEFGKDQGVLRAWDVERGGPLLAVADGAVNDTIAYLPARNELLTGSALLPDAARRGVAPEGQLSFWPVDQGPRFLAAPQRRIALATDPRRTPRALQLPRALGVVNAADGSPRYALTVEQDLTAKPPQPPYSLRLTDLAASRFGATIAQAPLRFTSAAQSAQPALAVDPTGERIAVALGETREIACYAVSDLVAGKLDPRQSLRTAGVAMATVGFASHQGKPGLVLNTQGSDRPGAVARAFAPGDMVFDFARRTLTNAGAGWVLDRPDLGHDWTVEPAAGEPVSGQGGSPRSLRLRQGREAWRTIELPTGETVTAFAFHPRGTMGVPVLAVASTAGSGEPFLRLYDGRTGDWIRQFTGHSERIRSLAFSADGRFLASVANDRTICIWSLVDLGGVMGKRGQIRGLAVTADGDRHVVAKPPSPTAAGGPALKPGDVIVGVVSGAGMKQPKSVVEFYNAVSMLKPGEPASIVRLEPASKQVEVPVAVVQGTDERKPLFSMFITPGEAERVWKWVGWNPQGPYETSDLEAESLIGWHFNTGDPATPTRFARAPEYRDRFYHDQILKALIERGSLPPPQAPPLPAPNLSLAVDQNADIVGVDQLLVRQAPATLTLTVVDRPIPPELVESVTAQIGDLGTTELRSNLDRDWTGDISKLDWRPGTIYPVRIALRTKENPTQTFTVYRQIRFQPPAPTLALATKAQAPPAVVNQPDYLVQASVQSAKGLAVKVRITHEPSGTTREQVVRDAAPIAIPFTLEPGANRFQVRAVNQNALAGYEEDESAEAPPLTVIYKKKALAPTVELHVAAPGSDPNLPTRGGETIRVTTPQALLRGKIVGAEPLVEATLAALGPPAQEPAKPLIGFTGGRVSAFPFSAPITLRPGSQSFVVRARSADSDSGEARVTVFYQPELPRLVEQRVTPERPVLFDHEDQPTVALAARFAAPSDSQSFKGEILVNSNAVPQPRILPARVVAEPAGGGGAPAAKILNLAADVPLADGENRIRLRLTNEWGAEWVGAEKVVTYRKPPHILEVTTPAQTDTGSTAVTAVVESATDLSEAQVEVQHDGQSAWAKAEFSRRPGPTWSVTAADVPVEPGESRIRVRARNRDGWNHSASPTATLTFTRRPAQEAPILETPQTPLTTGLGAIPIPIAVSSASPLVKTELRRMLSESDWETIETGELKPSGQDEKGRTRFQGAATARLNEGVNQFELVVANGDGQSHLTFAVSRIQPPIRFAVDGFETEGDRTKRIPPQGPIPDGRAWIVGRVIWPDAEVQRRSGSARLQVLVNGFPQVEAPLVRSRDRELAPRDASPQSGPLETPFRAGILLNRADNQIEMKLSGAVAASDRLPLAVACRNPNLKQRLHMLVIGVGAQDKLALKRQAVQAVNGTLNSESAEERVFKTPAFGTARVYGPLCGEFTKMHVMAQISLICEQIRLRTNASEAPNGSEVVLIYYQGGEWVGADKASLLIRRSSDRTFIDGVTVDELVRPFVSTRGAKLLLLDVAATGPYRSEELWSRDVPHIGLMRFLWLSTTNEEPTRIPDELRLIKVVTDVLPRSITLGQATSEISGRYSRLRSKYPNHFVFEDRPLPDPFYDLLFGKP